MLGVGRRGPLGSERFVRVPGVPGGPSAIAAGGPADRTSTAGSPIDDERLAWIAMSTVEGVGPATFGSLLRRFGSADAALRAFERGAGLTGPIPPDPDAHGDRRLAIGPDVVAALAVARAGAAGVLAETRRLGLDSVLMLDPGYPASLRATDLAPPVLYVRGDPDALGHEPAVAVVGTRRPTDAGRRIAARIAAAVVGGGGAIVSGLAIGIDGAAHEGALIETGRTIAVLGAGHANLTPAAHRGLADRIAASGGAVVSEFPPRVRPSTGTFPRRNRIISGLAGATVVVEAAARSGALITAAWALEQGRDCYLVPGRIDDAAARGCLRFLRDHAGLARIVAGVPELLEDLALEAGGPIDASGPALGAIERRIAGLVEAGGATLDELAVQTGLPAATLLGALTTLELRGFVVPVLGRYRPAGRLLTGGSAAVVGDRAGSAGPACHG